MIYDKEAIQKAGWRKYKLLLKKLEPVDVFETGETLVITSLAKKLYNNTSVWWVILEYNNILPVPNLVVEDSLKLFSLRDLDALTTKHLEGITKENSRRELL